MQKNFKQVPYQIAFVDGIEISGKNKNVPFIIVNEKDAIDVPFLNNEAYDINVSMVQDSMWVENVGKDLISTFFHLPPGYLNILTVDEKINFAVVKDGQMKFFFSIDNIFRIKQ